MLEIVIAVIGSAIAGIWDLKTTEVPDEIPILMSASGLFLWFIYALNGNFFPFIVSLGIGTAVLIFGIMLYRRGKWGGADAWIFAAIMYLVPVYNNKIFFLDYLPNLIWVSTAFTVVYAIFLGITNRRIFGYFFDDIKRNAAAVFGLPVVIVAFFYLLTTALFPGRAPFPTLSIFSMLLLLTIFWRYAKVIENRVFVRKIPANDLRDGDVLNSMIWRGLTHEEVAKIKKSKKFVTIKEGMRFVPVFCITLVVTLLYGNLLFWFL